MRIMKETVGAGLLGLALMLGGCGTKNAQPLTPLIELWSDAPCARCTGYWMPGTHAPSPRTVYRIDSDLPEIYTTNGVLYSTRPVLPPFDMVDGKPVPEEMRTQKNLGFESIDDDFEVFLYHLSREHAPRETRRIVVYLRNTGDIPATVAPRQVMEHGPNAGNPTSVESALTRRVLTEAWDIVADPLTVEPGQGKVIGWTKRLGAGADGADTTRSTFVTGILRAGVSGTKGGKPSLEVSVISVPGLDNLEELDSQAEALHNTGAQSGETNMDLTIPPPECHVRRVGGVSPNVMWVSAPLRFDVATLPDEDIYFQMAKFAVQSVGCEEARQSVDMLLHPGYVHADTVGNYMMEYLVTMTLSNSGQEPRQVDLQFGKDDAPIGLAWQMAIGDEPATIAQLESLPVQIEWAGKRRTDNAPYFTKTMLPDGPLTIAPGEQTTVSMRLMVVGTSSLPYQIHLKPM